jgi:uncharacterized protein HemY
MFAAAFMSFARRSDLLILGTRGEKWTERPEMMLLRAARLMETIDEESEADRYE